MTSKVRKINHRIIPSLLNTSANDDDDASSIDEEEGLPYKPPPQGSASTTLRFQKTMSTKMLSMNGCINTASRTKTLQNSQSAMSFLSSSYGIRQQSSTIEIQPNNGLYFESIEYGKLYSMTCSIRNTSLTANRIRIKGPITEYFSVNYVPQKKTAPGLDIRVEVEVRIPNNAEALEYSDCMGVSMEGTKESITVPFFARKPRAIIQFISDGDCSNNFINFGYLSLKQSVTKVFKLINSGTATGTLYFPSMPHVLWSPVSSMTLQPNQCGEVSLTLFGIIDTAYRGEDEIEVKVTNSLEPFVLAFQVSMITPSITLQTINNQSVVSDELDFGPLFYGQQKIIQLQLVNSGHETIYFRIHNHQHMNDLSNDQSLTSNHLDDDHAVTEDETEVNGQYSKNHKINHHPTSKSTHINNKNKTSINHKNNNSNTNDVLKEQQQYIENGMLRIEPPFGEYVIQPFSKTVLHACFVPKMLKPSSGFSKIFMADIRRDMDVSKTFHIECSNSGNNSNGESNVSSPIVASTDNHSGSISEDNDKNHGVNKNPDSTTTTLATTTIIPLTLLAKVSLPNVTITPTKLLFGCCSSYDRRDILVSLTNHTSKSMTFEFPLIPHFKTNTPLVKLASQETMTVIVTFQPHQLGTFKALMPIKIGGGIHYINLKVSGECDEITNNGDNNNSNSFHNTTSTTTSNLNKSFSGMIGGIDKLPEDFTRELNLASPDDGFKKNKIHYKSKTFTGRMNLLLKKEYEKQQRMKLLNANQEKWRQQQEWQQQMTNFHFKKSSNGSEDDDTNYNNNDKKISFITSGNSPEKSTTTTATVSAAVVLTGRNRHTFMNKEFAFGRRNSAYRPPPIPNSGSYDTHDTTPTTTSSTTSPIKSRTASEIMLSMNTAANSSSSATMNPSSPVMWNRRASATGFFSADEPTSYRLDMTMTIMKKKLNEAKYNDFLAISHSTRQQIKAHRALTRCVSVGLPDRGDPFGIDMGMHSLSIATADAGDNASRSGVLSHNRSNIITATPSASASGGGLFEDIIDVDAPIPRLREKVTDKARRNIIYTHISHTNNNNTSQSVSPGRR